MKNINNTLALNSLSVQNSNASSVSLSPLCSCVSNGSHPGHSGTIS